MLKWFSPRKVAISNSILAALAYFGNLFSPIQLFCQPVMWTSVSLIIFLIAFISWDFIIDRRLKAAAMVAQGFGFAACVYCILFIGVDYITALPGILWFGLGALAFVPVIFAAQLIWRFAKSNYSLQLSWIIGFILPIIFLWHFARQYNEVCTTIASSEAGTAETTAALLENNYITERIVGMHFRYHTQICMYDGWRPPLHDPILVASMWVNKGWDPLWRVDRHAPGREERIKLYRIMFPDRNPQANCACAINKDAMSYRNDPRFRSK